MGGWGSVTPRVAGGAGAQPRYTPRFARQAVGLPPGQTTAFARRCRCARRSARRGKGAGVLPRPVPPQPPARLGGAAPGVRYASRPDGRNVPGWGGAGRGKPPAHPHTGAGGDRAPTERPAQADGLCKAGAATGAAGCGLAKAAGLCNGWRAPSRRPCGGLERGRRLRRPARHICGASEASGTGAAPSRAGGKG